MVTWIAVDLYRFISLSYFSDCRPCVEEAVVHFKGTLNPLVLILLSQHCPSAPDLSGPGLGTWIGNWMLSLSLMFRDSSKPASGNALRPALSSMGATCKARLLSPWSVASPSQELYMYKIHAGIQRCSRKKKDASYFACWNQNILDALG